ncbi:hypothetical protein J2Y45_003714 [Dyadobacter sp. BE34]|uniref:Uncharacterized protein n=1 Tax=Dyadobacter fermentans TaxID=94254 RepID=A0ABU1QZU6_9BACT|nr:hypothetical protein [Dyadobacter fermentans]MDR7044263.1 hypothetical protein [Dyadobacter sp. BE242]MDR7198574.1 hypothetical protein [Dyadobacter sp. BE34]MDR7216536.1 hypothetical protein [Dyadobacter sp. BE31]MDR7263938.1 hypothetical protein [Dyadobacter sp. BE32]
MKRFKMTLAGDIITKKDIYGYFCYYYTYRNL